MNDDQLLTEAREAFADVRMRVPPEDVIRRGSARRARRRAGLATGAASALAAAAFGLISAIPSGGQVQLDAWTVSQHANGAITLTIRELVDPAGLQKKLRADGVPASITFSAKGNSACKLIPEPQQDQSAKVFGLALPPSRQGISLTIDQSAIPPGTGVQIAGFRVTNPGHPDKPGTISWSATLVEASAACTGS